MPQEENKPKFFIEPLGKEHDREAFSCGVEALDQYLQRQAAQDVKKHVAAVFVLLMAVMAPLRRPPRERWRRERFLDRLIEPEG